jgi:hypothetical protein
MYEGGANKVHYKKEKEAEFEAVKGVSRHASEPLELIRQHTQVC